MEGRTGNPYDHIGGGVNSETTRGLYPNKIFGMLSGVDGEIRPDLSRTLDTIVIKTTAQQDYRALEYLDNLDVSFDLTYDLNDHNCVHVMREFLGAAYIPTPDVNRPRDLMRYLHDRYDNKR